MDQPRYKVLRQEYGKTFRPDGKQGGQWTVHLEHEDGTKAHIELPDEHYSAENVHALAQHQANTVHEVSQLPHGGPHIAVAHGQQ